MISFPISIADSLSLVFPLHLPFPPLFSSIFQWNRIIFSEPRITCTKSADNSSQQNDVIDAAADFEAQANQTIVNKYRSLKSLKQQMTKMKRDFNAKVLELQDEKRIKCTILSEKIEMFRENYKKLYSNDNDIDVEEFTQNVIYFEGKSFKVEH